MSDSTDANSFITFFERLKEIGRSVQMTLITFAKMFNFRDPSNISLIILLLAQLVMIFASFILMAMVMWKTQFDATRKNPLNKDKLSYSVANACNFTDIIVKRKIKYPYVMFPIMIVISVILILFTIGYISAKRSWGSQSIIIYVILFACTIQTLVWIAGYFVIFKPSKYVLDSLNAKIKLFNKLVDDNMYIRDSQFLATISTIPKHSVETSKIIGKALCVIKADTSTADIVKIFFTLNIYRHFLKLGIDSNVAKDAVSGIFSKYSIALKLFGNAPSTAADYLSYGTHIIKDYSVEYVDILSNFKGGDSKLPSIDVSKLENVKKAVVGAQELTSKANDLANDFFPDDALYSFYTMVFAFVFISLLPFIVWSAIFARKKYKESRQGALNESLKNAMSDVISSIANIKAK